jgi:hypothetical protein
MQPQQHQPHQNQQQATNNQSQAAPEQHCLETLLRNIEGLLAIAAHNARQQQSQLHLQKAELRAELAAQIERERELREHIEKQLNEEQKLECCTKNGSRRSADFVASWSKSCI